MTNEPEEESHEVLAEQRLGPRGLHVKLDRGFEDGTYCVYVEFDVLASRIGFGPAHRQAVEYCHLLKEQLGRFSGHSLDETEDASRDAAPGRKRDLELTYVTFPLVTNDGRFHDKAIKETFRLSVARASQQWDQEHARVSTQRRGRQREAFRRQLGLLLASDAYTHLDEGTRERLLDEVSALAYPPRGREC